MAKWICPTAEIGRSEDQIALPVSMKERYINGALEHETEC
jgi:hypothetical protein